MHTLKDIERLLSKAPADFSQFEFDTFIAGKHASKSRQLRSVMQAICKDESALKINEDETRCAVSKLYLDEQLAQIKSRLEIQHKWLDSFTADELQSCMENFESDEPNYWIHSIGSEAAVEILSAGKMSAETLHKMMLLEQDHFIKTVFVATELSRKIQEMTIAAEKMMNGDAE